MKSIIKTLTAEQKVWYGTLIAHTLTIEGVPRTFEENFTKIATPLFSSNDEVVAIIAQTFGDELPETTGNATLTKEILQEVLLSLIRFGYYFGGLNAKKKVFFRRVATKFEFSGREFENLYRDVLLQESAKANLKPAIITQKYSCKVCLAPNQVEHYKVKNKTQNTIFDPFGIAIYQGGRDGFASVDYNRIRILICSNCYFASMSPELFNSDKEEEVETIRINFDKKFQDLWRSQHTQCEEILKKTKGKIFSSRRPLDAAIDSYRLALYTHNHLIRSYPDNYYFHRYWVAAQMQLAAIYFSKNANKLGARHLKQAKDLLDRFVTKLNIEESILSFKLNALLSIYFKDFKMASGCLNMLLRIKEKDYHKLSAGAKPVLNRSIEIVERAWDDRTEFPEIVDTFHTNLKKKG